MVSDLTEDDHVSFWGRQNSMIFARSVFPMINLMITAAMLSPFVNHRLSKPVNKNITCLPAGTLSTPPLPIISSARFFPATYCPFLRGILEIPIFESIIMGSSFRCHESGWVTGYPMPIICHLGNRPQGNSSYFKDGWMIFASGNADYLFK